MPATTQTIETVGVPAHTPTPTPDTVSLGEVGVWLAFTVGIAVFCGVAWNGLKRAVHSINTPLQTQLEKHELKIQHLEDGHKSIRDEVNALRSEIKDEFRDLKTDISKQIDRLSDAFTNKH